MNKDAVVLELIYKALQSLNKERESQSQARIRIAPDTLLFGADSELDSLSLVSVIVDIETLVSDQFGRAISLTDDRAMNREPVPFTNVASLKAYVIELLSEEE